MVVTRLLLGWNKYDICMPWNQHVLGCNMVGIFIWEALQKYRKQTFYYDRSYC